MYHLNQIYTPIINKHLPQDLRIVWFKFLAGNPVEPYDLLLVLITVANIFLNRKYKPKDHIHYPFSTPEEVIKFLLSQHFIMDHVPRCK